MKVFLLYPDRNFDFSPELPPYTVDLSRDLALNALFEAMAQGDDFLMEVIRRVMFTSLNETEVISYRQEILKDCLKYPAVVQQLYGLTLEFVEMKRKRWLWISRRHSRPSSILSGAQQLLEASLDLLRRLRQIADRFAGSFASRGFRRFFDMIRQELDDGYLVIVERHVRELRFTKGVLLSAQLGNGNEGSDYILCKPNDPDRKWIKSVFFSKSPIYSFSLHPRDDYGARVLGELLDRGLARAANAVAQAAEHIESFFHGLRQELAFYIGCLNLYAQLGQLGTAIAFPQPLNIERYRLSCTGLYDIALVLTMRREVVDNDVNVDGKSLVIITGPNQGGKTTFLRSVGLAQLMMQAGMFVAAKSFTGSLCSGIFTHFKREEDETMERGKFEEELERMSVVVELLRPGGLILLNETFANTNEREGSEVAIEVISALVEKGVRVFYVTHMYEFARRIQEKMRNNALFLRAERLPDGKRTFKMREGGPQERSYGEDLYREIFKQQCRV